MAEELHKIFGGIAVECSAPEPVTEGLPIGLPCEEGPLMPEGYGLGTGPWNFPGFWRWCASK